MRKVCFTSWQKPLESEKLNQLTYIGYAEEVCPTTQKHHWQGVAHSPIPMRPKAWRETLGTQDVFLTAQKGSNEQAIEYFRSPKLHGKEDYLQIYERGSPSIQGKASTNSLTALRLSMKYLRAKDILTICKNLQEIKTCEKLMSFERPLPMTREVVWIYGKSGTGKTRLAISMTDENDRWMYDSADGLGAFNGYKEEKHVILDELRPWSFKPEFLLRLLDRYEMRINVKYGHTRWMTDKVVITTIYDPVKFWNETRCREDCNQLTRRITNIICLDVPPKTDSGGECNEVVGNISISTSSHSVDTHEG